MNSNQESKPIDKNGYPIPRSEICFRCNEEFWLTFVPLKKIYARRNFWSYWTEEEENKEKFVDNFCLKSVFKSEDKGFYFENIKNISKS